MSMSIDNDQRRHHARSDAETRTDNCGLKQLPVSEVPVPELLSVLERRVTELEQYEILHINEYLPRDRLKRHQYLSTLRDTGIGLICYHFSQTATGSVENMHFLWRAADDPDLRDQTETVRRIHEKIPVYHSRMVRREFIKAASILNISPMYSRYLYKLVTNDASAPINSQVREVDDRVMRYVALGDDSIVLDLRQITTSGYTCLTSSSTLPKL